MRTLGEGVEMTREKILNPLIVMGLTMSFSYHLAFVVKTWNPPKNDPNHVSIALDDHTLGTSSIRRWDEIIQHWNPRIGPNTLPTSRSFHFQGTYICI